MSSNFDKTVTMKRRPHPGGSVCAQKRFPNETHADACWTFPLALCDSDAPIHPDDITRDDERVTCTACREILRLIEAVK